MYLSEAFIFMNEELSVTFFCCAVPLKTTNRISVRSEIDFLKFILYIQFKHHIDADFIINTLKPCHRTLRFAALHVIDIF